MRYNMQKSVNIISVITVVAVIWGSLCFSGSDKIYVLIAILMFSVVLTAWNLWKTKTKLTLTRFGGWFLTFNFFLCFYGLISYYPGGYSLPYHMVIVGAVLLLNENLKMNKNHLIPYLNSIAIVGTIFIGTYLIIAEWTMIAEKVPLILKGASWYRLGNKNGWNSNSIALHMSLFSVITSIMLFISDQKRRWNIVAYGLQIVILLLTGSKKGFALLVLPMIYVPFFLSKGKRKWKYFLFGLLSTLLVFYLVFNIEFFYRLIGYRIIDMLGTVGMISSGYHISNSTQLRGGMIQIGMEMFKEHPIFGWGWNAFAVESGFGMYSHNNMIEIMVSMGIFGLLMYYFFYIVCFIKASFFFRKRNMRIILLFLGCIVFIDITSINMYGSIVTYFLLMICSNFERNLLLYDRERKADTQ